MLNILFAHTNSIFNLVVCTKHALVQANQPPEEYRAYITAPARKVASPFPDGKLVYDFVFKKDRGKWGTWLDLIEDVALPSDAEFYKILVPTPDSTRYSYLIDALVIHDEPLLLVGPTGTGKVSVSNSIL